MWLNDDPALIEKRHGAYIRFVANILRGIAYYMEWALKFVLYLALHFVDFLEALTGVLLQVLRVIKLLIKALFTFGVLLRFAGRSFGAEGSFLFVLGLLTYFCFWREDGSFVSAVSGVLHINVCIATLCVWALTIPIGGLLVCIRLRRKINQQIDLLVNYDKFDMNESEFAAKNTEIFADKSTETDWIIPDLDASDDQEVFLSKDPLPSGRGSDVTRRKDSSSSEGTGKDEDEGGSRSGGKRGRPGRGRGRKSIPSVSSRWRTKDKKS